jgi:flagellar hook protein FlgE
MMGTIYIGLSGMTAYSKGLDVISNNVANLNTPGFKLTAPSFGDALYRSTGGAIEGAAGAPTRGAGVNVDTQQTSFRQGDLRETGNSLDAGVDGNGFFVIERDGQQVFTRAGQFEFNADGELIDRETRGKVLVSTETLGNTTFNVTDLRTLKPKATSEVLLTGTLARTGTSTSFDLPGIPIIDSGGGTQQVKAKFTRDADNARMWFVEVTDADNNILGSNAVLFQADGTPEADRNTVNLTMKPKDLPEFIVTLKIGAGGSFSGITSTSFSTATQVSVLKQDGVTIGSLTTTTFDDRGRVTLTYSNGEKRTPATLLLAQIDTPTQVRALGDALFVAADGQQITLAPAQTAGRGRIVGNKLELSNVDLTQQFTDLIIIQRGYQASSQMTSVANEMIQQLLNIGQQRR